MNFFPVHFEWIKTDLVPVWKAADKGTRQLYELHHEQKDAEYGVHLSDACLPEGEVGSQVLGRHRQHQYPEHNRDLLLQIVLLAEP